MSDVAIHADHVNNGITRQEAISHLRELQPQLSRTQAENYFQRTFFKHHKGKIKKKTVVAQRTTTKRSAIAVAQQFFWFMQYEEGLNFLREKNKRVCRKTGKHFGELIEHFVIGGDETNLIADADGDLKIIGDAGKR